MAKFSPCLSGLPARRHVASSFGANVATSSPQSADNCFSDQGQIAFRHCAISSRLFQSIKHLSFVMAGDVDEHGLRLSAAHERQRQLSIEFRTTAVTKDYINRDSIQDGKEDCFGARPVQFVLDPLPFQSGLNEFSVSLAVFQM